MISNAPKGSRKIIPSIALHTRNRILLTVFLLGALLAYASVSYSRAAFIPKVARTRARRASNLRHNELTTNLVYFNNDSITQTLGCAKAVKGDEQLDYTCFYHSPSKAADIVPDTILLETSSTCAAVYKPLLADHGRPWCIRQTEVKSTLATIPAEDKLHMPGTTLVMGRLDGPNPTHQLNIHFYFIYLWMKRVGIKIGDLNLVIDCHDPHWIGTYGLGLAKAFGTMHFLNELPQATTFERVKFSEPGQFPFHLSQYETDKIADCNMIELAWGVKKQYGIDPLKNPNPQRVVVALRRPFESRKLNNADELLAASKSFGFDAEAVTFGDLSFSDQMKVVSDAAVLVGVTGSDLVSLIFLPTDAVIVEIFPVAHGEQVFTPELWHLARMSGKQHLQYVSPYNSTLMLDDNGQMIGDRPVHQVNSTDVHVPSLAALVKSATLMGQHRTRTRVRIESGWRKGRARCTVRDVEWYVHEVPYESWN